MNHQIKFSSPASEDAKGWEERSFPLGCGWFGVNLFGGVGEELVTVTHNAVLCGRELAGSIRGNLTQALELRIRVQSPELGSPGAQADKVGRIAPRPPKMESLIGEKCPSSANCTINSALRTPHSAIDHYERILDIDHAIATVKYCIGDVEYRREAFCSYPDKVLAMRVSATAHGKQLPVSIEISAGIPFASEADDGIYTRHGTIRNDGNVVAADGFFPFYGVRFAGRVEKIAEADGSTVILFACDTNYRLRPETFTLPRDKKLDPNDDPGPRADAILDAAKGMGWDALKTAHLADMSRTLGAASLDLDPDPSDALLDTDMLLENYRQGHQSRYLEETYWQYGRYLLVASSRPGGLPANLQGIWAYGKISPWGSGYWHNINVQMNYWPAFSTNIAECFVPYAEYNAAFRPTTRDTAVAYLKRIGSEMVPAPNEKSDMWCVSCALYPYDTGSGPGKQDGPGTGGLTTRLFTDWWEFTEDEKALRDYIFPTLHGMADFLTRCVKDVDGKALAAFSASPEQMDLRVPWDGNWAHDPPFYNTVGCTFDQSLIWENSQALVRLARHMGIEDEVVKRAARQLDRYDPILIGESGQIKEYREEKKYGEIGEYHHRHISQLMGVMPGTLVTPAKPEWMEAAKKTLDFRGDESTGWALAHRLCCRARVHDGEGAYRLLHNLLAKRTFDNLWDAHPPFQIDGNFGATAGITEMLVQSHERDENGKYVVRPLPALPKAWPKGKARGLRVRGNSYADIEWREGKITSFNVHNHESGLFGTVTLRKKIMTEDEKFIERTKSEKPFGDGYRKLWTDELYAEIDERIEKYRKADFMCDGIPAGGDVEVRQVTSDFQVGCNMFNFGQLGKPEWDAQYRATWEKDGIFNAATIPFYWASFEFERGKPRYVSTPGDAPERWAKFRKDRDYKPVCHWTPECPWEWRRPAPDRLIEFCQKNGIDMHGHCIIYPAWDPDWIKPIAARDLDELQACYDKRVKDIALYYKDTLQQWDVVNENWNRQSGTEHPNDWICVHDGLWNRRVFVPKDYTFKALKIAEQYFPKNVKVCINDAAQDGYFALAKTLSDRGARFDVMGFQMHIFNDIAALKNAYGVDCTPNGMHWDPNYQMETFRKIDKLGRPIHLSEVTIPSPRSLLPEAEADAIQARLVRDNFRLWFSWPSIYRITYWNLVDGTGAEILASGFYNKDLSKKPVYETVDQLVNHEWRTNLKLKADAAGRLRFRGFKGDYELVYNGKDGKKVIRKVAVR